MTPLERPRLAADVFVVGGGASAPGFYGLMKERGYPVVAASTMLLPLQRAGIKVDVCCILDGSVVMPLHFAGAVTDGELVHVQAVRPEIPAGWVGPKTLVHAKDVGGSSVLHLCVMEAIRRGATTLHIIGADFCYSRGLSHAEGVVTAYNINLHEKQQAENGYGEMVATERSLLHYRSELAHITVKFPGVRFIRYGREGLPVPGIEWAAAEGLGAQGDRSV